MDDEEIDALDMSREELLRRMQTGKPARFARRLPLRFRWWAFRSRFRLMWRALSGKPMVVVRDCMVVNDAEFHGGIWIDKDARVEITNCHIRDYTGHALEIKR